MQKNQESTKITQGNMQGIMINELTNTD